MTSYTSTMYYAVAQGRILCIVTSWDECKSLIDGFKGAVYKKFKTRSDAEEFMMANKPPPVIESAPMNTLESIVPVDSSTFEADYYVYTDGACANNGKEGAYAGLGIFFGADDIRNVSLKVNGKQSNNTAELGAILHAYKIIELDIKVGMKIGIVSDSEYAIRCVTSYGQKCADSGWKKDIPNKDLVKQTFETYQGIPNVRFLHVRAHTEKTDMHSVGNDGADRLANQAIGLEHCPYSKVDKVYVEVPFTRKEEVKALGGKWDPSKKQWYIMSNAPNKTEVLAKFAVV